MITTQSVPPQIYVPAAKRRFTNAEVAEIARGATIRVGKSAPDRLAKAVAKLEKCIKAYKDAHEDVSRTETAMGDAGVFGFWIDCTIYRPLFTSHCTVLSIDDIDRAMKRVSLQCRQERSHYLASLRKNPGHPLALEMKQRIEGCRRDLKKLPVVWKAARKAFRAHRAKVIGTRRRACILSKQRREGGALATMWRAFEKVENLPVATQADAAAAIRAASIAIGSKMIWPDGVQPLLEKARTWLLR